MAKIQAQKDYWDFSAFILLISYAFLQIAHWPLFPYHMDIHYHLHSAWGFMRAGGYSGWDFWQYAPFGRINIYPPFFHLILALLFKVGVNPVFLAKFFQTLIPTLFLFTLWHVIKKNYSRRLGLFVLIALSSSFSFYLSLINHIPATLAMIFGLLAFDQLLNSKILRVILLLTLCFYTHIGISWLFAIAFILYGLFNKQSLRLILKIITVTLVLSLPVVWKQLAGLTMMSSSMIKEKYNCEFKTIDYLLAIAGLLVAWQKGRKYLIFTALFFASLIFLSYPYRFFSAEGYLPTIFLVALSLDHLYERANCKGAIFKVLFFILLIFVFLFSPSVVMKKEEGNNQVRSSLYFFDSAFVNMLFPSHNPRVSSEIVWFQDEFLSSARLIKSNSDIDDIIYCRLFNVSVALGGISGRAASNGLLPEIVPTERFDPYSVSKIILATKSDDPVALEDLIKRYHLIELGDNKIFIVYKNPLCRTKAIIRKASLNFTLILLIAGLFALVFLKSEKLERILLRW